MLWIILKKATAEQGPTTKYEPCRQKKKFGAGLVHVAWAAQRLKTVAPKLPISRETKI